LLFREFFGRVLLLVARMVAPGLVVVRLQDHVSESGGQSGRTASDDNPLTTPENSVRAEIAAPVDLDIRVVVENVLPAVAASGRVPWRTRPGVVVVYRLASRKNRYKQHWNQVSHGHSPSGLTRCTTKIEPSITHLNYTTKI
jgi:hypothetical protein